jgi:hypothetical protein
MALWGNNDAVGSGGTVSLDYSTGVVTGSGTTFGETGAAKVGDVIRFGERGGGSTYYGDAAIVSIASSTQLTIGSTAGLSGAAIAGAEFYISELPVSSIKDSTFSEASYGVDDKLIYGISDADSQNLGGPAGYEKIDAGWVGITTYVDNHGNLRVKREVLVAMSGITTGNIPYPTAEG